MNKHLKTAAIVGAAIFAANVAFNATTLDESVGEKLPGFDPASGNGPVVVRLAGTAAAVVAALVLLKVKV